MFWVQAALIVVFGSVECTSRAQLDGFLLLWAARPAFLILASAMADRIQALGPQKSPRGPHEFPK